MSEVAFLDVDTQVDFMSPAGKLYVPGAEAIQPNLAKLIGLAQAQGIPLISSVDAHAEDDPEFATWPPHAVAGTPGQVKIAETTTATAQVVPNRPGVELPDPKQVHVVLEKQDLPVFTNQHAAQVFAATGAQRFVVFGVATDYCVKAAVLGLLERGYQVAIVEDAVRAVVPEAGEAALQELLARGATLTTTGRLLQQHASAA
jgi:nicotinamidase/pyrazinamidase